MPVDVDLSKTLEFLYKNPFAVFIILTAVFAFLYFQQNRELNALSIELGGLRVEQQKMNEIIILKTRIIEMSCGMLVE